MSNQSVTKSQKDVTSSSSILSRYQDAIVGKRSFRFIIYYEICMFFSSTPGALGLFMRKLLWPKLFFACGKGVFFGANIVLRHPNRISIGDRVVISEGCILDARAPEEKVALEMGDDGILSTNVRIAAKNGIVKIGERFGVGAQTVIHASYKNPVAIGNDVAIGPQCYISGGGNYNIDRTDIPISQQGMKISGGSVIGNGAWLGAKASVFGGVEIGDHTVLGTGSIATKNIPGMSIATGVPAKVIKKRL